MAGTKKTKGMAGGGMAMKKTKGMAGGGMSMKKTKGMAGGGAMKRTKGMAGGGKSTKYMAGGGAMKKTKGMSRGGRVMGGGATETGREAKVQTYNEYVRNMFGGGMTNPKGRQDKRS